MKIEQASVAMKSDHSISSEYDFAIESTLSFRTIFADAEQQADAAATAPAASSAASSGAASGERQQRLLLLLEQIIGRLLSYLEDAGGSSSVLDGCALKQADGGTLATTDATSGQRPRLVMQWSRVASEQIEEHETSDFSSTGTVLTADGRTLDFTLGLSMCRDYSSDRTVIEGGTVELRDPLVINFDGTAAELAGQCFSFDLDADGSCENVHQLAGGSGYLALDRNGDGRINDGGELFGTASGDGFADLAAFDADGNGWLDESDAAFSTLRVWQRDASGADQLTTLRDAGVGALYLGSTTTPFALTGEDNRLFGQVRASGIYLNEDGSAGTLQQIDLAV